MVPTSKERKLVTLSALPQPWCAEASLSFHRQADRGTQHQGGATAPLKIQRAFARADGRCELPLLHTGGGLVGGDELSIGAELGPHSRVLLTSVAAQKVYGSVGRSRLAPDGSWSRQRLSFELQEGADLEWLPQEVVVFAGGLIEQSCRVELAEGASWLGADVVRLGRSADAETLGEGSWRSRLEVRRQGRWSVVDQLELAGESLRSSHGLAGMPVFGSLVWAAPAPVPETLLELCRADRAGLEGDMACGRLDLGLVARYRGPSSQAARFWFTRIWARIRAERGLASPVLPRVWPFQEDPWLVEVSEGSFRPV
ncbi:urease accessory protein UreD [Synechococcus sp. Cruz-9H2]|uniref:urease accessory protein UreD n=1 Tax=unclassified Synechococcus TaxID=2626047 RepID=UPI0020CB6BA0|nr:MULTISPECIES: urease accessory protein UreD [unclassified Synechococcus]MCP9819956.1 urease accessory protein UreD [Synechococcus sp. Cruz-9H2]MCP9844262.1 urease accessory protein UreD [Synechococcus sp. Edmonson 11F2]MCP9856386.1 urease accessory protein UreD [Synechococcus sp. Cruz-9C9]MCP9863671.1 urease accessory protein UreD [Synechococcus sp. Cruz-7E5]MCP9870866.1 urease accessory protein UreD [Synechococcus sp. Cruz-7B9]